MGLICLLAAYLPLVAFAATLVVREFYLNRHTILHDSVWLRNDPGEPRSGRPGNVYRPSRSYWELSRPNPKGDLIRKEWTVAFVVGLVILHITAIYFHASIIAYVFDDLYIFSDVKLSAPDTPLKGVLLLLCVGGWLLFIVTTWLFGTLAQDFSRELGDRRKVWQMTPNVWEYLACMPNEVTLLSSDQIRHELTVTESQESYLRARIFHCCSDLEKYISTNYGSLSVPDVEPFHTRYPRSVLMSQRAALRRVVLGANGDKQCASLNEHHYASLGEILSNEQLVRLRQIYLQIVGLESLVLLRPEVLGLELTMNQIDLLDQFHESLRKERIVILKTIPDEQFGSHLGYLQEVEEGLKSAKSRFEDAGVAVLSPQQIQEFDNMLGEPFVAFANSTEFRDCLIQAI